MKIAVVDPDTQTREFIVNVMMYSVNRKVLSFENGAALRAYLKTGEPLDLVISEIDLPDGSGLDLLEAVKTDHPKAVRVALSSTAGNEKQAARRNIDSFLAKPFTVNDLFAIVQHFVVEDAE